MQTHYNVISYKDKPRLRTAVELLKTTEEIEQKLEEVCTQLVTHASTFSCYTCTALFIKNNLHYRHVMFCDVYFYYKCKENLLILTCNDYVYR